MNFSTTPPWASIAVCQRAKLVASTERVSRVQLGEDGEVDQVGEEDADQLALFAALTGDELGPAIPQRCERGLDHVVPEDGPLRSSAAMAFDGGEVAEAPAPTARRTGRGHAAW